jgi:hypothetical protein
VAAEEEASQEKSGLTSGGPAEYWDWCTVYPSTFGGVAVGERDTKPSEQATSVESKKISRREFLKIAGIAGAMVGLARARSLTACGEEATTTTTAARPHDGWCYHYYGRCHHYGHATAEMAEVKIGFVTPQTVASPRSASPTCTVDRAKEAIGDGLVCGDGQKHRWYHRLG